MELVILLILQSIYPIIVMSGSIICIVIIMISYLLICQDKPEYQEYQVINTQYLLKFEYLAYHTIDYMILYTKQFGQ